MTKSLLLALPFILTASVLRAGDAPVFDTGWIPSKPEVLTYRSKAKQGDGLYQVSVSRGPGGIEVYMNIITPGFTKTVWGRMTSDLRPLESKSRIIVNDQMTMTTDCSYTTNRLRIATLMSPYNQIAKNTLSCSNLVVDFSESPLLARTLPLKQGANFKFDSLNPRQNSLVPLSLQVVGTEAIQGRECYKVEGSDFEGPSTLWVEKGGHHRVMRIEQAETGRVTELIL